VLLHGAPHLRAEGGDLRAEVPGTGGVPDAVEHRAAERGEAGPRGAHQAGVPLVVAPHGHDDAVAVLPHERGNRDTLQAVGGREPEDVVPHDGQVAGGARGAHQEHAVGVHEGLEVGHFRARLRPDEQPRAALAEHPRLFERQGGVEPGVLDRTREADARRVALEVPVHVLDGQLHRGPQGLPLCGPASGQCEETAEQDLLLGLLGGRGAAGAKGHGGCHQHRGCPPNVVPGSHASLLSAIP
jgi:hypothetical protein